MNKPLSVLVLAPFLPFPLHAGNRVRLFNLLEELASRHSVALLLQTSPTTRPEDVDFFLNHARSLAIDVTLVRQPNGSVASRIWMKAKFVLDSLANGVLTEECYLNSRQFRRAVAALLASRQYDVALITYFFNGVPEILDSGIPVVCDAGDILWLNAQAARGMKGRRLRRLRRREAGVFKRCAAVICVTDENAAVARTMIGPGARVEVLATVRTRDSRGQPPNETRPGRASTIAFYGDLGSPMNRDAVAYLVAQIWPRIRAIRPDSRLIVFGGRGADLADEVQRVGAEFLGPCDDLSATLAKVDAVVLPLRFGSGIKGRVLECMELGVPLVGTAAAFEGIPVHDGVHVLEAETAERIADACLALLESEELRLGLSRAGRQLFLCKYSWEQTYGAIHDYISAAASARC